MLAKIGADFGAVTKRRLPAESKNQWADQQETAT
jgi:hypothetical protein